MFTVYHLEVFVLLLLLFLLLFFADDRVLSTVMSQHFTRDLVTCVSNWYRRRKIHKDSIKF